MSKKKKKIKRLKQRIKELEANQAFPSVLDTLRLARAPLFKGETSDSSKLIAERI